MLINITFQFGNFEAGSSSYLENLSTGILGALVGVLGAYFIYRISIHAIRRDRLKYVVSLLNSIIPSAKRQAGYCEEQGNATKADPLRMPMLKIEANRDFKRLSDKVEQEGVYHAFLDKYSRKNPDTYSKFQKIYGYIDYLDYTLEQLIDFNEKTNAALWERKKAYALTFRQVKEKIESIIIDTVFQQTYPEYINFLQQTLEKFFDNNPEGENVVYSYSTLITPVRGYVMRNGPVTMQNTELMFLLNNTVNHYTGIEMAGKHAADDYLEYQKNIEKATLNLENETAELRRDYE